MLKKTLNKARGSSKTSPKELNKKKIRLIVAILFLFSLCYAMLKPINKFKKSEKMNRKELMKLKNK